MTGVQPEITRITRLAHLAAVACLVVLEACSGDGTSAPGAIPECTGNVTLAVSAGLTPTFSWTPACKVYYLNVRTVVGGNDTWSVGNAALENTIAPGVVYGTAPPGTRSIQGPVPLVAGTEYRVFIAYTIGGPQGGDEAAGEARFTPP